jgi:hypothetical protein
MLLGFKNVDMWATLGDASTFVNIIR